MVDITIRGLNDELIVRELIKQTYDCRVVWSQVDANQYHAQIVQGTFPVTWDFYIIRTKDNVDYVYTLEVLKNTVFYSSLNSNNIPVMGDLFDVAASFVLDPTAHANRTLQFLRSLRTCIDLKSFDIVGSGGIVVGGAAGVTGGGGGGSGGSLWFWHTSYWRKANQTGNDIPWDDTAFDPAFTTGGLPGNCSSSGIMRFRYGVTGATSPPSGNPDSDLLKIFSPYVGTWIGTPGQIGSILIPHLIHDANIVGMTLQISKSAFSSVVNATPTVYDTIIELDNNGVISTNMPNPNPWPKSDLPFPVTTYGSQTELWSYDGLSNPKITGANIDSDGFGTLVKAHIANNPSNGTIAEINCVTLGVYYYFPIFYSNCAVCKSLPTATYTATVSGAGAFDGTYVLPRVSDSTDPNAPGGRWQLVHGTFTVTFFLGYDFESDFTNNVINTTAPVYIAELSVVDNSGNLVYFIDVLVNQLDCATFQNLSIPFDQGVGVSNTATCTVSANP